MIILLLWMLLLVWWFILVPAALLLAIGVVLRVCELILGKKGGELGSGAVTVAGGLLLLAPFSFMVIMLVC